MLLTTRSKQVKAIFKDRERLIALSRDESRHKTQPYKPLHEILPDGAWAGEPCFIIGGGPSLQGFDFERLRGQGRVIAINRALEFVPWADVLFFMDWKLYKRYHDKPEARKHWDAFTGHKVFLNLMGRRVEDVRSVHSRGRTGVSASLTKGLYHGSHSGYGALGLALALGARPIYLLGYDMRQQHGRSHFHSGYGAKGHGGVCHAFLKAFTASEEKMRGLTHVINLSPHSALKVFRFGNVEEVLNGQLRKDMGDDPLPVQESVVLCPSPAS